jgi:hypothetical protein
MISDACGHFIREADGPDDATTSYVAALTTVAAAVTCARLGLPEEMVLPMGHAMIEANRAFVEQ